MRRSTRPIFVFFPAVLLVVLQAWGGTLSVVPAPRVVRQLNGSFRYVPSRTVVHLALADSTGVMSALEEIDSTSSALFGGVPKRGVAGANVLWAGVPGNDREFDRRCRIKNTVPGDSLGDEGYVLLVEQHMVLVVARSARGVFYGLQTFIQLLRGSAARNGMIQAVRITDWPDLRVRAIMDDISRGPVPTREYFRDQIRRCAELKVNTITYYTEHVVLTRSHPEFAPPGAALSIEEWHDLARYARRYHITLVGNFQSFGHFEKILASPAYAHLGEGKSLLSPALEESYSFLRDIYQEMVPAFSAPFFLTNCDETFDLGKGASKLLVDSMGIGRVYVSHILRLRQMLRQLGTRMMIWGDVLLQHPEAIESVPRDVIIGTWTYDTLTDYHRFIAPFQSRGFDVLVTPGVLNSQRVIPDFHQSQINIQRFVRDGLADGAAGAMTTVWDDGGSALFARDWFGVAFAADRMWNCDTSDTTYSDRFDVALYGDRFHASARGLECLQDIGGLTPTYGMNERALWSPVLPAAGKSLRLNVLEWDRVLAIACRADSLFGLGYPLVWRGDLEALRFTARLYGAAARTRLSIRETSRLYARAADRSKNDIVQCRRDLVAIIEMFATLEREFTALRDRNVALWLDENRLYSLDLVERPYESRIEDLRDVRRRVRNALADVEAGGSLPPPEAVRLAIVDSEGWYFLDWLVTGPITDNRLDIDFLAGDGGEKSSSPAVTEEFPWEGTTYRWKRLSAPGPAEVDLRAEYPAARAATVYAFATIESPDSSTVRAFVGVGGTLRIFLNGTPLHDATGGLHVDRDSISLPLVTGRNRLLLKICGMEDGPWGFSLRLPGSVVHNRKNRYRIGN